MWKSMIKKVMSFYTVLAEAKNMQGAKDKIRAFVDSPQSVDLIMKAFNYKDSKFKTMTHSDLWTSQIMFSLREDGESESLKVSGEILKLGNFLVFVQLIRRTTMT